MEKNTSIALMKDLFNGVDNFIGTRTVVGDPIKVDGATIIPLIDATCGMAVGEYNKNGKSSGAGGMSTKMTVTAILVVQNGYTKLINVKNQDSISKLIDMIPDILNKVTGKNQISDKAVEFAENMSENERKK